MGCVLPGKIVWDEAQGYMRFGFDYFKGKFQIPKMPPLREIMLQFLRSVFLWPSSRRASWHKVAQRSGTLETIDLRLNGPGPGP